MIYIYLACLIIGGILLGGSLLLGALHADADGDSDVDGDADHDVGADHDADHDVDATGIWLPFFSVRFWVFNLTFFGLCGTLLTIMQVGFIVTGLVSLLVGMVCGTGAAFIVHRLGRTDVTGDIASSAEFIGVVGKVLVTVAPGRRGKIRVEVRSNMVDLVAKTSDDETLDAGSKVLVVEFEDNVALVTRAVVARDSLV